jgi:hypothetical protein
MPQVRAVALQSLESQQEALEGMMGSAGDADAAHYAFLFGTIERFLEDPSTAPALPPPPNAPPGAPIGLSPMDYLEGSSWIMDRGFGAAWGPWLDAMELPWYWWTPGE